MTPDSHPVITINKKLNNRRYEATIYIHRHHPRLHGDEGAGNRH